MSARAAVLVLAAAGLAWSCSVDRKTDKLACSSQDQCTPMGRVCEQGYCVVDPNAHFDAASDAFVPVCPSACNGGCTFGGTPTCVIQGGGGAAITCPTGFNCEIVCNGPGACGAITCSGTGSCDVTCNGGGACGALTCGPGKCSETCNQSGACGNLSCSSSCNCNAMCAPADACATMTCPSKPGNRYCATGGAAGAPCDSSAFQQCQSCP